MMKTKETRIYAPIPTPETCEQTANGLTVTSVVLQGKEDQRIGRSCEAQFIEARGSNSNITAVLNTTNPLAERLPTLFGSELNKKTEGSPRLTHQANADRAFRSTLEQLSLEQTDGIALAYERPVNRTSQLFLALGPKTLGIITGKDRYGSRVTTYYQPHEEEMDSNGFYLPRNLRIMQGATLILATGLEQFPPQTAEFLAYAYTYAQEISQVLQSDLAGTKTQQETVDAYLSLDFPQTVNEHLLSAIDALRFDPALQQSVQEGNSNAVIAKLLAQDLSTLQRDTIGNPTLHHNVAVITSHIS